ncbi:conserved protein, unknown function [Hepatocystis sp. ex Piliocolobus tephrosceles]|nr:conserved protein, unknown function [Hepatocystis sp. ex Piliocolobus tephrosceles]
MAERKVLNKYIPPDFDPEKLEEKKRLLKKMEKKINKNDNNKKKKKNLLNIRMMYPFTLRCNKCKSFTYVGTKFNSRVEKLRDEHYLNIPIWKFYGKCSECNNAFVFKTDPKNGDYVLIEGGIRTYDAHKEQVVADNYYNNTSEKVDETDKVKKTEKESYNASIELQMNEQLEELQKLNIRHINKFDSINKALNMLYEKNQLQTNENNFFMNNLEPEDEKAFFHLLCKSRSTTNLNEKGDILLDKNILGNVETCMGPKYNETISEEVIEDLEADVVTHETTFEATHEVAQNTIHEEPNDNLTCDSNTQNKLKNSSINKKKELIKPLKLLEKNHNFIIKKKKKEDIKSIFNEYNTDSSENDD